MTTLLQSPPARLPTAAAPPSIARTRTLADFLHDLGDVPLDRVLFDPPVGTAVEADVVRIHAAEGRLCELVDGTLVEKHVGYTESFLGILLATFLNNFVLPRRLGIVTGADGTVRLFPGLIRIPDVAFASWRRLPNGRLPTEPVPDLVPDLLVEVLSASNTPAEMRRKLRDYFGAGARLVWFVDPASRTVAVHTSADGAPTVLDATRVLDGGEVLPGFQLKLDDYFGALDATAPTA